MNNSYITIIKEKRTALSRKRVPLNQNECTDDFRIGVPFEQNLHSAIYCVVLEYSILFPTFAFFQNVFHLPFGDKSIIRFKAANSVQCISLNEFLAGEDIEVTNVEKNRKIH